MPINLLFILILSALCPLLASAEVKELPTPVLVDPSFQGANAISFSDELPEDGRKGIKKVKPKKKPKINFRGYPKQKKLMEEMCMALYQDGRSLAVSNMSEDYKGGKTRCIGCKSFFRIIFTHCRKEPRKPKPVRKKKKVIEEEVAEENKEEIKEELPPAPRLEPSLLVLDLASRIFTVLALDKKQIDIHLEVVNYLVEELRKQEGKTKGEINYYDILAEFIKSPFNRYEQDKLEEEAKALFKKQQLEREFMFDSQLNFKEDQEMFDGELLED